MCARNGEQKLLTKQAENWVLARLNEILKSRHPKRETLRVIALIQLADRRVNRPRKPRRIAA